MPIEWTKNGSIPRRLTDTNAVYRDEGGLSYTGVIGDDERFSSMFGYTAAPERPSFNPVAETLDWNGTEWLVVELPEPEAPPAAPIRVTKADFRRLLTRSEQGLVEIRSKEIDAMTPAEFIAAPLAQAFRVMMKAFEEPLEFIELNHPDTISAVTNVMATHLPLAEGRVEQILSNQPPL